MEDGRYWDKYCRYMNNDMEIYYEKNILQHIREFNFLEDHAMKLIESADVYGHEEDPRDPGMF